MARGVKHNDATKAAVLAALLAGQGVSATAQAFKLSQSLVSGWKKELAAGKFDEVRSLKKDRFDELLSGCLEASLRALTAQAEVMADPEFIRQQSAEQLGVLHGVVADRVIRMLEMLFRAEGR